MVDDQKISDGDDQSVVLTNTNKGKSCKGCLYYSSLMKTNHRNPLCVGVTRALPQVPGYMISESEMEASKEGLSLSDFKYACVGYSVYLDKKVNPDGQPRDRAELPFCVDIELLVDKQDFSTERHPSHILSHKTRNKEDAPTFSPPRTYKPPNSIGEEFLSRFTRNVSLVASGIARNLYRVGNYIKDNVDDILYPYRRRPK